MAFPSISTGVYGYPVDLAAATALETVDAWVGAHPDALDAVTFVLFSADSLGAFELARDRSEPWPRPARAARPTRSSASGRSTGPSSLGRACSSGGMSRHSRSSSTSSACRPRSRRTRTSGSGRASRTSPRHRLSDAIEARQAVRIGLMRTTLHLVSTRDALGLAPIMDGVLRRVYRSSALAKELGDVDQAPIIEAARELLTAGPLTPAALGAALRERFPGPPPSALALLARYHLPLVQVPPRGLWRQTSRTTNTTLEAWTDGTPAAYALEDLVRRYLAAFGPASTADIRTWSWLTGVREIVDRIRR